MSKSKNLQEEFEASRSRLFNLPIVSEIFKRLESGIHPRICYHTASHSVDVASEAIHLGVHEGVDDRGIELLAIAAAYHDAGYLEQDLSNEFIGAGMAVEAMRSVGSYSLEECNLVEQMVLDTTLRQTETGFAQIPTTPIAGVLLDADLSNFGRADFFIKSELYRVELNIADTREYRGWVLALVSGHTWYTKSAHTLRQKQKEQNIIRLRQMIDAMPLA